MATSQGRFVWHDLMTTDVDGAKKFYTRIAQWTTKPWDDEGEYQLWERNGVAVGGVGRLASDSRHPEPAWLPSVYVYDVDACVRQVPKIGGTVISPPREIPEVGCWAIVAAPDGAPLGLFESDKPPAMTDDDARAGEFSWHELLSDDHQASWEFYRQLFHWEKIRDFDMGATGTYLIFGMNGKEFGGMFTRAPEMPPANWTSYIQVDSVAAAAASVRELGGKVMREPHQVPTGTWISICTDPQGAMFALASSTP